MTPDSEVLEGDCVAVMAGLDAESVDAIVTDPPYGLEFMGKGWDKLGWQGGGGFSKPGIGARDTAWPSSSSTSRFGAANPTCATCGGRLRGAKKCECGEPAWKPIGKRRNAENDGLPNDMTGGGMGRQMSAMQDWHERWAREALRVAKPGAHLLAFGGTRTYHRLACAIEDAGWEIRDCLVWAYASGFPKSLNFPDGWGTALKPAWEPIVMARKPLRGTVAANREAHGTGALNIDGTRIGYVSDADYAATVAEQSGPRSWKRVKTDATSIDLVPTGEISANPSGRWPANVILTDPIFDGDTPGVVGGGYQESTSIPGSWAPRGAFPIDNPEPTIYGDSGTYSRFFLIPKAARSDREPLLGGLEERRVGQRTDHERDGRQWDIPGSHATPRQNHHPTVKPTELMRHLVRLVTPPGGLVLDPFLGSGTTALAAEMEGFRWLGIEKEPEYVAIARARLLGTQRGLGLSA